MNPRTLWIGLPAYNEEASIAPLFGRILSVFPEKTLPYRVILYDDGCTDGTLAAARSWQDRLNLEFIGVPSNRGLGLALRSLVAHAARHGLPQDALFILDCDDTHDPGQIPAMLAALDHCDIVIASRYRRGAQIDGLTAHRRVLSMGAAALFAILHPCRGVRDYTCGYRAYRVALLQRALAHYHDDGLVREPGFACMVELLLKLCRMGARVHEVPLVLRYDRKQGRSKMDVGGTTLRLLGRLLSWRIRGLV